MATPTLDPEDVDHVMRKFRVVLDLIDAGRITPEPLELAAMGQIARDCGARDLAMRAERIARRLLPQWKRDLT